MKIIGGGLLVIFSCIGFGRLIIWAVKERFAGGPKALFFNSNKVI